MTTESDFQEVGENFLLHFGKQGMRWGHRNSKSSSSSSSKSKKTSTKATSKKTPTKAHSETSSGSGWGGTFLLLGAVAAVRVVARVAADNRYREQHPELFQQGASFVQSHIGILNTHIT